MNRVSVIRPAGRLAPIGGQEAAAEQPAEMPTLRRYLRILLRWKYIILGIVVFCLLAGLIITLLMTPKYTARTTLEISRESSRVTDIQGVERDASVADQEFYQTQYGLLRSQSLAERVAAQLRLSEDPKFFARFGVRRQTPAFTLTAGRYPASGRAERQRVAADTLLDQLSVEPTRLSRLVDLKFTSPDPAFSAAVVNAWAANFIRVSLDRRYQATSYARTFLEGRLDQLRSRLEDSERQLVSYASAQNIVNLPAATSSDGATLPERSVAADSLTALNTALAQATADRVQAEARFREEGKNGSSTEALRNEAINSLRQKRAELSAEYQKLMVQFEPDYPAAKAAKAQIDQLDRSISREEGRVTGSMESDYRAAVDRESALNGRVESLKGNMLNLRRRTIQYNILQRDVDTNRQLYDGLLQRYKEIGIAGGVGANNIAIVDQGEIPEKPSSPRMALNLALALLAGLVLGALAALGLEQIDEAIADPAELTRRLGLPLLGTVPKLTTGEPREALLDRKSELVDAYIAVQTNLEFTTEHGVPRTLGVTSTRPAEGKSTTALALAVTLARAHKRVVLVDGDMRSPSVHHFAGVSHDLGLSNYLAGSDDIDSLLVKMPDFEFYAMPAGPIPPNAAELLTGDRLPMLLDQLLLTFDHVVVDAPPVMGLADAPLIASRVEGVTYVVESHGIRTSLVRTALARLQSANARVIGGVLTKFEAKRAHFGYGYDYGYGYGRDTNKGK